MSIETNLSRKSVRKEHFVVAFLHGGHVRRQLWHGDHPLPIGKPFRWILERTPTGVRVVKLRSAAQEPHSARVHVLSDQQIDQSGVVQLTPELSLSVSRSNDLVPLHHNPTRTLTDTEHLRLFTCRGDWVKESTDVSSHLTVAVAGAPVFEIASSGQGSTRTWKISSKNSTLVAIGFQFDQPCSIAQLLDASILLGSTAWRFGVAPLPVEIGQDSVDESEQQWVKRSFAAAFALLAALLLLSLIWPKSDPKNEELIPPQYAKIVLTQPMKPSEPAPAPGVEAKSTAESHATKAVEKAAVVQAFRAKSLQNAVSGLLKGGMTSLLAQSDFVAGAAQSTAARKSFDARNPSLRTTAAEVGEANNHRVTVGGLGGGGSQGGGAGAVGYGKGEHAGVNGQGQHVIAMDTPGAAVEDGLTKDEVGEVIHRHMSEVRYCYEAAMVRQSDIEGKLMVAFTISAAGIVTDAQVKQSTLPDPRLDDCIIRRLVTWKFPNPKGGVTVAVTYPFLFKTLGK